MSQDLDNYRALRSKMSAEKTGTVTKKRRGNPNLKGGSRKGVPNKTTVQLKDMILQALDGAGGAAYLQARANDPKTAAAFLGLVGKVLPMQVTGDGGGAVQHAVRVEFIKPKE